MASKQPRGHFKREPHLSIFSKKEDERVTQLIRKVLTNQRFCFGLMICDWSIGKTSGDVTRARQNSNYKSKCSFIFILDQRIKSTTFLLKLFVLFYVSITLIIVIFCEKVQKGKRSKDWQVKGCVIHT